MTLMELVIYLMIWVLLSTPNAVIMRYASDRLAEAFGIEPKPLDGADFIILAMFAPFGPLGWIIGFPMTVWWCAGFKRPTPPEQER